MLSNKVAVALLGLLALVGAAGAGAFFASRPSVQSMVTEDVKTSAPDAATKAVDSTESVVDDSAPQTETAPPVAEPPTPAPSQPAAPARPAQRPRRESVPVASRTSPAKRDSHAPSTAPAARTARTEEPWANAPFDPHPANVPSATSATRTPADESIARTERVDPVEQLPPPAPPQPQFQEVTVPTDSVIGLRFESSLSSETARVEERVEARVARDVRADGRVAIPAGSRMIGSVSVVDRGGKMKEQARLGVRFHTVILADGTEVPLQTETIYRVGDSPGSASAAKVGGGAIGGAILGAILGGGKGAAIGGAVGAAGGTAAVMAGGRRAATISAGSPVTVKVLSPVTVNVEKE